MARDRAYAPGMIHRYDNKSQTLWDRGDLKVQLNVPGNSRPMGFCDGTDADLAELKELAEAEGAEDTKIHRQVLKSGREIWTLGGGAGAPGAAET
jgi:hypothetical protein